MADADVVITGTILTVDDARPTADPRAVPPEEIADLDVRATFLAGRQVYAP
jgi:predicted amidohydrolase YtcJ